MLAKVVYLLLATVMFCIKTYAAIQTPAPKSITVPSNSNGNFTVYWSMNSDANLLRMSQTTSANKLAGGVDPICIGSCETAYEYKLEQSKNNGSYQIIYIGPLKSKRISVGSGTYRYRVAAKNAEFPFSPYSQFKYSNPVIVTAEQTPPDDGGVDTPPSDVVNLNAAFINGKAGVSGGQATYHIPIELPPGRNGVKPSVSLNYNSNSRNGILGVGWNLTAGSQISRCPSIHAIDGLSRAVTFNSSYDRLCLDGKRLILTSGVYGQGGAEYRTEIDSFVKVVQSGDINSSDAKFTLLNPDGSIAYYGQANNSRLIPQNISYIYSWHISSVSRSGGNNVINFDYKKPVEGEILLSNIWYTGTTSSKGDRRVHFEYESRTDISESYLSGGRIVHTERLSDVHTYVGSRLVKKYEIKYKLSAATRRSIVSSIKECGKYKSSYQCGQISSFTWSDSLNVAEPETLKLGGQEVFSDLVEINSFAPQGDLDGDGSRDFIGFNTNAEQENLGANNATVTDSCYKPTNTYNYHCLEIDLDLDGVNDAFKFSNNQLFVDFSSDQSGYLNTGVTINVSTSSNQIPESIYGVLDVDGDNWPDLVVYKHSNETHHRAEVYLHSKSPYSPYNESSVIYEFDQKVRTAGGKTIYPISYEPYEAMSIVGDLDNNGQVDFLVSTLTNAQFSFPSGNPNQFLLNTSTPNNIVFNTSAAIKGSDSDTVNPSFFSHYADVNGDSLPDLIAWYDGVTKLRINEGGTFGPIMDIGSSAALESRTNHMVFGPGIQGSVSIPKYLHAIRMHDVNGDGKQELILPSERLITGCSSVNDSYLGGRQNYCGDQLYGEYSTTSQEFPKAFINVSNRDDSIYQYDAIYFDLQTDGSYVARRESTNIIGSSSQMILLDAFGDGLQDAVFTYGPRTNHLNYILNPNSSMFGANYGAYIVRNYGDGTGVSHSDYHVVDYLTAVEDGFNNDYTWTYKPLSSGIESAGGNLYSVKHELQGDGNLLFSSSMNVVSSFEQSNGIGGSQTTEFAYEDAMYNINGRGFLGFKKIVEKDIARNKKTIISFLQKFPFVGLIKGQSTFIDGIEVSNTSYTWQDNPQHSISNVFHNINTNIVENSFGLLGSYEKRYTKQQIIQLADVDAYGNIKKKTTKITDYVHSGENSYSTINETNFTPDTSNWFLRKYSSKKKTNKVLERGWQNDPESRSNASSWQLSTVNAWDATHLIPKTTTITASNSNCKLVTNIVFNSYGLPSSSTQTGQNRSCENLPSRTTHFNYTKNGTSSANDGYLPYKVTNAEGHYSTSQYDVGFGKVTKITDPNSVVSESEYDAIGRLIRNKRTGFPTQYIRYLLADNKANAPSQSKMLIRTTAAGSPTEETFSDRLGRVLRVATESFSGSTYQFVDKAYDSLGRLTRESLPYYMGDAISYTQYGSYDGFDRPGWRTIPNNSSSGLLSSYSYDGLTTTIEVGGRHMSRTYGSQGWLYETVDAASNSNRFSYDGAGNPLVIADANLKKILATYNGFGHKTQINDPNQGVTTFGYNTFGEVEYQKDANNVVLTITLDKLGRITRKSTVGGYGNGVASYSWDTLKKGLLTSESQNGITRSYTYNSALQKLTSSVTVSSSVGGDNIKRTITHSYDDFYGRPKTLSYPQDLTLSYEYTASGYLESTKDNDTGFVYRKITELDAKGDITRSVIANNRINIQRDYNNDGTMANTYAYLGSTQLHGHLYQNYDSFLNLENEKNTRTGINKTYGYDQLNRLTSYTFANNGAFNTFAYTGNVSYGYDAVGNLLKKSDYSVNSLDAYSYSGSGSCGAKPNAVCTVRKLNGSTVSFNYDHRGNLTSGDGITSIKYNSLDKPVEVLGRGANNSARSSFVYGSDGMRALQYRTVSGQTIKTHYVDKLFEIDNDGSWRAFIEDVAVKSYTPSQGHKLQFMLRDRLGSATTIVNENGQIINRRYFDPFGRVATASSGDSIGTTDLINTNRYRRGFTDHEHMDEQKLIHMNGRVYDYNIGRFLSVDPFIQSPASTQSVNPYSYIMNNPLSGTDPTGYVSCDVGCTKISFSLVGDKAIAAAERTQAQVSAALNLFNGSQVSIQKKAMESISDLDVSNYSNASTNVGGGSNLPDQSISEDQLELATSGKFLDFWKSRWENNKDPVARTALIGWKKGDLVGAEGWEELAASHTWSDLEGYIKDNNLNVSMEKVGADLALAHARTVMGDTHGVKGLLSPHQVAQYHHQVFDKHSIPAGIFGGTHRIGGHWYMPDVEVPTRNGWTHMIMPPESYSGTWCGGCDSTPRSDGM